MTNSAEFDPTNMPAENDAIPDAAQISHRKLREIIVEKFNLEEFRLLCYDLNVNFDELGGPSDPLSLRTAALIDYIHRRQRLRVLLLTLKKNRPSFTWDQVLLGKDETETIPSDLPPAVTRQSSGASDTIIASRSFTALFRLMRHPETREAVISFRTVLEGASAQIDKMNDFKLIHDLFQELENRYYLIDNDRKRLPDDDTAWVSLELNESELNAKIDDLLKITRQAVFAEEAAHWLQKLEDIQKDMRTAVENFDLGALNKAVRSLYRVLNQQPSRINAQLITTANNLRLVNLENTITLICDKINASEFDTELELVTEIKQGGSALSGIDTQLKHLTSEHDAWQAVDDELRRVEATLESDIDELKDV